MAKATASAAAYKSDSSDDLLSPSCGSRSGKKGGKEGGGLSGGVGTLIVRVVQARNLPAAQGGGFFSSGTSNPYCMLEFEGQTHTTSVVSGTVDPVWPREQFFFEVKMPAFHADSEESASLKMGAKAAANGGAIAGGSFSSAEPHLHVKLVHKASDAQARGAGAPRDPTVFSKPGAAPVLGAGDKVLGEAFVNIVDLATARRKAIDGWFNLSPEGGAVKLTVEYDVLDPVPAVGEAVRLLGFGASADLWPLPLREEFKVEGYADEHKERLLVSYRTSEGWRCTAELHRFHVISAGRHRSILDEYQNKMLDAAIGFMDTPLMAVLGGALDRVEEEGLAAVGADVWQGLKKGAARWWDLGLGTAVEDVRYAIGLTKTEQDQRDAAAAAGGGGVSSRREGGPEAGREEYVYDLLPSELLERVLCPITGAPMKDPVVAADGHTYEREAIERWLTEHDTSPLTGARLETPMVFKNYALAATIAELRSQNEALRRKKREEEEQQAPVAVEEEEEGESKADSLKREQQLARAASPPPAPVVVVSAGAEESKASGTPRASSSSTPPPPVSPSSSSSRHRMLGPALPASSSSSPPPPVQREASGPPPVLSDDDELLKAIEDTVRTHLWREGGGPTTAAALTEEEELEPAAAATPPEEGQDQEAKQPPVVMVEEEEQQQEGKPTTTTEVEEEEEEEGKGQPEGAAVEEEEEEEEEETAPPEQAPEPLGGGGVVQSVLEGVLDDVMARATTTTEHHPHD